MDTLDKVKFSPTDAPFARELKLFLTTTCLIENVGSDETTTSVFEQPYRFATKFIAWTCQRESQGWSDLCPVTREMVDLEMGKLGFLPCQNIHLTGNHYNGIRLMK